MKAIIIILLFALTAFSSGFDCEKYSLTETKTGSSGHHKPRPDAPSNLIAVAVSQTQIDLSWADNSRVEEGFRIERKTSATGYSPIATLGPNITAYSDTGLTDGTTYYYRVCAYNKSGDSAYSNEAFATTPLNAPSALNATVISSTQIDLSWTDNSNSGSGFKIESRQGGTTDYSLIATVGIDIISYSDTDLAPSTEYYYRVKAYNATGDSEYSPEANATTSAPSGGWSNVRGGYTHTIAVKTDGTVWSFGSNSCGQLGLGDVVTRTTPSQIGTASNWETISAGAFHTLIMKTNHTLWSFGYNTFGQLGLGDSGINRNTPTQIATWNDWSLIVAGSDHTIGIKTNNTIWSWGQNWYGQLGLGGTVNRNTPALISGSNWSIVVAGDRHSIATKNGTLWAWGYNEYGQLGLGNTIDRNTPTQIGSASDWLVVSEINLSVISAGESHSLALKSNRTLWTWGFNAYGQLGLETSNNRTTPTQVGTDSDWSTIAGGGRHTLALKTNGTLWAWGYNRYGQLGDGTTNDYRYTPCHIGTESNWAQIAAGFMHSLGITRNNTLWSWGQNAYGQLGLGDTIDRNTPAQISSGGTSNPPSAPSALTATAVSSNQINLTWINVADELGYKIERSPITNTNYVQIATTATDIVSYNDTTVTPSNTYYYRVRVYNTAGNGGYSPEANATTPAAITGDWSIIAAWGHTIGIKTNGALLAWGYNSSGQLGLGDTTNRYTPTLVGAASDGVQIAARNTHTLEIKTNGRLWTWGSNSYGQLGLGDTTNRYTPSLIGTTTDWTKITAGCEYTLGIKTNKTIWGWGNNIYGQLGLGDTTNRYTPTSIGTTSVWSQITAGERHTIGIKITYTLWGWGNNSYGQLGLGGFVSRNTPSQIGSNSDWSTVTVGSYYTLGIKANGTLWAWGYNAYGQLGLETSDNRTTPTQVGSNSDWSTITGGGIHTLAIRTNGSLWAWGYNRDGQLGLGNTTDYHYTPSQVSTMCDWSMVSAGENYTVARKTNDSIWAWGDNQYGQLGLGDTISRNTPTIVGE